MDIIGSDIQVEDGEYTRLHNLILEVLAQARFTASEFRVIIFLLRKTYGFGKKEDDLSLSQWEEGTNTDRTQVSRTLADLVEKNVIYRSHSPKPYCHRYGFNKYVENWDASIFERVESRKTRNLDQEVKENIDPVVKENTNLDQGVKEILTKRSNNKRKDTKEKTLVVPTHRKSKANPEEPTDGASREWFGALCWLVHGHKDYGLLTTEERTAIGRTAKAIRSSPNQYTLDDLRTWYRDIWSKEWPGKQRDKATIQPPTLKQIKTGIGRVRPVEDATFVETDSTPSVLDFAVKDIIA